MNSSIKVCILSDNRIAHEHEMAKNMRNRNGEPIEFAQNIVFGTNEQDADVVATDNSLVINRIRENCRYFCFGPRFAAIGSTARENVTILPKFDAEVVYRMIARTHKVRSNMHSYIRQSKQSGMPSSLVCI